MKTINRNSATKKHLKSVFSNENIWFYTDNGTEDQHKSGAKESIRSDKESLKPVNYSLKLTEDPPVVTSKYSAFIVDWQINGD